MACGDKVDVYEEGYFNVVDGSIVQLNSDDPDVDLKNAEKYNTLWDAKVIKVCYEKLVTERKLSKKK